MSKEIIESEKNKIDNEINSFNSETSEEFQTGGFFWSSNGNIDNDNKLLLAAEQGNSEVVRFMIDNNMFNNIESIDENGKNLLHHLSSYNDNNQDLLNRIISINNSDNFINKQDKKGNTPIHCAVINNNMNMCHNLIENGGNKKIKNNEGLFVETSEESVVENINNSQNSSNNNHEIINSFKNMEGGEKVLGDRKNKFINENRSLNNRVSKEERELAKLLQNQAGEIHDRVKKKIMEIMNVDEEEMRYIKAAIYQWVKKNNPDLSNLDRAVEMEKNTNKEFIEELKKSGFLEKTKKGGFNSLSSEENSELFKYNY